jgi:hypothetical protein
MLELIAVDEHCSAPAKYKFRLRFKLWLRKDSPKKTVAVAVDIDVVANSVQCLPICRKELHALENTSAVGKMTFARRAPGSRRSHFMPISLLQHKRAQIITR